MSHIQDRLRSITSALKNFDKQEATFSDVASEAAPSEVSMAESDISHESIAESIKSARPMRSVQAMPDNSLASLVAAPSAAEPATTKKKSMFWIVLVVVILLVVFGIVLYAIYKKRKRAQNSQNGSEDKRRKNEPNARQVRSKDPFSQIDELDRPKPRRNQHEDFATSVAIPGGQPPVPQQAEPEDDDMLPL